MSSSSQPKDSLDNLIINGESIDEIMNECIIDLSTTSANMNSANIASGIYIYNNTTSPQSITFDSNITSSGSVGIYSIGTTSASDTITLTETDNYSIFNIPKEWVDCLPPLHRIEDMCERYPGLKIAFENFKVFYEMVKDDYDNPNPEK